MISTSVFGVIDCADTACVIAAGTFDESVVATAAVEFINTPLPPLPFSIALEGAHFLDASGLATLGARLTCDVSASVVVQFRIDQQSSGGGRTIAGSSFTYPCTPGVDIHVFSDYLAAFSPGDARVLIKATVGSDVASDFATVTLQTWEETIDALTAALAGPDGDQVLADLIEAIYWRVTYNPQFRQAFFRAILQG